MRKQTGFTLMEVLFTLMVAGILVGVGAPSFKTSVQNSRLISQANDLLALLTYARSQAVLEAKTAVVCASNNQTSCSGSNWASGYLVCQPDCSVPANILRVQTALSGSNTLTNTSSLSSITFSAAGALTTGASLYFDLCDSRRASYGRAIYVYPAGQARVSTTVGKLMDGTTALTC